MAARLCVRSSLLGALFPPDAVIYYNRRCLYDARHWRHDSDLFAGGSSSAACTSRARTRTVGADRFDKGPAGYRRLRQLEFDVLSNLPRPGCAETILRGSLLPGLNRCEPFDPNGLS